MVIKDLESTTVENPGRLIRTIRHRYMFASKDTIDYTTDFVIWDRDKKEFVEAQVYPNRAKNNFLEHLKDIYNISKKYGIRHALKYDWKCTKLEIDWVFSQTTFADREFIRF